MTYNAAFNYLQYQSKFLQLFGYVHALFLLRNVQSFLWKFNMSQSRCILDNRNLPTEFNSKHLEIELPQGYEDVNSAAIQHLRWQTLSQTVTSKTYYYSNEECHSVTRKKTGFESWSMQWTWMINVKLWKTNTFFKSIHLNQLLMLFKVDCSSSWHFIKRNPCPFILLSFSTSRMTSNFLKLARIPIRNFRNLKDLAEFEI